MNRPIALAMAIIAVFLAALYAFVSLRSPTSGASGNATSIASGGAVGSATASGEHVNASEYLMAVEALKGILERARSVYLAALARGNGSGVYLTEPYSNLSRGLILNSTIVNETLLTIGNTSYTYVILNVYNASSGWNFTPQRVEVDGVVAELLPRNQTVTYTGGQPYEYLITYDGRAYRGTVWVMGVGLSLRFHEFVFNPSSSYPLSGSPRLG
ncbi:MAG: hypothetical protein ACP5HK_07030 [Acidilobus sp.]